CRGEQLGVRRGNEKMVGVERVNGFAAGQVHYVNAPKRAGQRRLVHDGVDLLGKVLFAWRLFGRRSKQVDGKQQNKNSADTHSQTQHGNCGRLYNRGMQRRSYTWRLRSRELKLGARTLVMGILNVTPDSFSDGGKFLSRDHAVGHALQ